MPTYSYKCSSCAHEFDIQQSINEEAKSVC
ncbi:MAG: FmdB family transcriptional regulator, partial [Microbacteriaceae bacterium]|nr:FmdB family transcriptional regulator [Microbacteriaceae bacterium]